MPQTSNDLQQINVDDTAGKLKMHSKLSQRWAPFAKLFSSNWLLCAVLFCIAMGFNLYRLGVPGIWFDEAFSVELARQPFACLPQLQRGEGDALPVGVPTGTIPTLENDSLGS